jgi:hypothetical protein
MKKIYSVLICSTLFTLIMNNASALSKKDDWSSIRRGNKNVAIIQPADPATHFGRLGLFNACVTSEELRSIVPVKQCVSYKVIKRGSPGTELDEKEVRKCDKHEDRDVSLERYHMEPVCLQRAPSTEVSNNECTEWGNQSVTYPASYNLEVITLTSLDNQHLFTKTLALPECR